MSTAARKARKSAGIRLTKTPKTPTSIEERSHTWRTRFVKMREEIRPTRVGVNRYGITDLGWREPNRYITRSGHLTKAAQS